MQVKTIELSLVRGGFFTLSQWSASTEGHKAPMVVPHQNVGHPHVYLSRQFIPHGDTDSFAAVGTSLGNTSAFRRPVTVDLPASLACKVVAHLSVSALSSSWVIKESSGMQSQ